MSYENKYLKYKSKYTNLKEYVNNSLQQGGSLHIHDNNICKNCLNKINNKNNSFYGKDIMELDNLTVTPSMMDAYGYELKGGHTEFKNNKIFKGDEDDNKKLNKDKTQNSNNHKKINNSDDLEDLDDLDDLDEDAEEDIDDDDDDDDLSELGDLSEKNNDDEKINSKKNNDDEKINSEKSKHKGDNKFSNKKRMFINSHNSSDSNDSSDSNISNLDTSSN